MLGHITEQTSGNQKWRRGEFALSHWLRLDVDEGPLWWWTYVRLELQDDHYVPRHAWQCQGNLYRALSEVLPDRAKPEHTQGRKDGLFRPVVESRYDGIRQCPLIWGRFRGHGDAKWAFTSSWCKKALSNVQSLRCQQSWDDYSLGRHLWAYWAEFENFRAWNRRWFQLD